MAARGESGSKKGRLLAMLETGGVRVHVDARRRGVRLPASLATKPHVTLEIGPNAFVRDLTVDDDGIGCTLSFGGRPFFCVLPWNAVSAMTPRPGAAAVCSVDAPPQPTPDPRPPAVLPRESQRVPKTASRNTGSRLAIRPPPLATSRPTTSRSYLRIVK